MFWWMKLDLVFLVGRTASSGMFWCVCELIMILGSLSVNGWVLCSCLASCLAWGVQLWSLQVIEWRSVLALRRRSLGELSPIDIT